jgi:hypothetical protein
MIELGNINNLEKKVSKLFIQSLSIKHEYYTTNQRKINLFSELYIYLCFFCEYNERIIIYESENYKNIRKKLANMPTINTPSSIDYIKETVNLSHNFYNHLLLNDKDISDKFTKETKADKYKKLTNSIIRKLKIEMLLK